MGWSMPAKRQRRRRPTTDATSTNVHDMLAQRFLLLLPARSEDAAAAAHRGGRHAVTPRRPPAIDGREEVVSREELVMKCRHARHAKNRIIFRGARRFARPTACHAPPPPFSLRLCLFIEIHIQISRYLFMVGSMCV